MTFNNFEYFIFLLVCLVFPLLLTIFHPNSVIKKNLKPTLLAILFTCIPFWIWDILAVIYGHWDFNQSFITGLYIANLPLEEVLFFVVIPFCCLTIWTEIKAFTTWQDFWQRLTLKN